MILVFIFLWPPFFPFSIISIRSFLCNRQAKVLSLSASSLLSALQFSQLILINPFCRCQSFMLSLLAEPTSSSHACCQIDQPLCAESCCKVMTDKITNHLPKGAEPLIFFGCAVFVSLVGFIVEGFRRGFITRHNLCDQPLTEEETRCREEREAVEREERRRVQFVMDQNPRAPMLATSSCRPCRDSYRCFARSSPRTTAPWKTHSVWECHCYFPCGVVSNRYTRPVLHTVA
ncbi:hypothetical protein JOL62DRAFT_359248 [Phyllosticta paracitricarpa]|uniref:Transmembrane protein n=1 Tax=Phyllosticta paracitricarpa TaxID=2016321 RepID=A0ABR1MXA7_9PEZI